MLSDTIMSAPTIALTSALDTTHGVVAAPNPTRPHLAFLDGLRGLAALYVVVYHVWIWLAMQHLVRQDAVTYAAGLGGRAAVGAFIVLSGCCLMLPVAASNTGRLRGGAGEFLKRRAWRIIPPYYAAIVFSLACGALTSRVLQCAHVVDASQGAWRLGLRPTNLLAHLSLVHNLRPGWISTTNAVFWSIGLEWQIYFLLPLLLLPVWRRWGNAACITAGLIAGLAPHFLLPPRFNLDFTRIWLIALFTMGMASAAYIMRNRQDERNAATGVYQGHMLLYAAGAGVSIACLLGWLLQKAVWRGADWSFEIVAGAAFACLLAWCAGVGRQTGVAKPGLLRLLESRPVVALGTFSYSLYLTHWPMLGLLAALTQAVHLAPFATGVLLTVMGLPLSLGAGWLFYCAVERPALNYRAKQDKRTRDRAVKAHSTA